MATKKDSPGAKISLADFETPEAVNVQVEESEGKSAQTRKKPQAQAPVDALVDSKAKFSSEGQLSASEKKFYLARRAEYLKEFDLNKSSDIGLVHRIVMEEIFAERLYNKALEYPDMNLSREMESSAARYQRLLDGLGASRDRRLKNRDTGTSVSIADLAMEYSSVRKREYAGMKPKMQAEDAALTAELDQVLKLQYGSIAEQEGLDTEEDEE